jgi:hypothetical protein
LRIKAKETRLILHEHDDDDDDEYFSKICRENSSFIEIGQEQRALYMKSNILFNNISLISSQHEKCFGQSV